MVTARLLAMVFSLEGYYQLFTRGINFAMQVTSPASTRATCGQQFIEILSTGTTYLPDQAYFWVMKPKILRTVTETKDFSFTATNKLSTRMALLWVGHQ